MQRAAPPEVVALRTAVTASLQGLASGSPVIVACSGGPDSLALVGATAWAAPRAGHPVSVVVVDHGLQEGSAQVAERAAAMCGPLGVDRAEVVRVNVVGGGGLEAAARAARYEALQDAADAAGASAVLLGHTREDQAETVLLRLARGSGARSLSAMRAVNGLWRRPFLDVPRAVVHSACNAMLPEGAQSWADPHNDDEVFARVRVRRLLAGLGDALGAGAVLGLTRSAEQLRDDADALDALAVDALVTLKTDDVGSVDCADLAALPRAVRTRVLRLMCIAAGAPAEDLSWEHIQSIDALVVDWHGQGAVALPGAIAAMRTCGRLSVT
jgi:tRNA(Ile)-lysidine synthase